MDTTEIQKVVRDFYWQLNANKWDYLEETDKFLEIKNLPRLNHDKIENMNGQITSKEIESKTSRQRKAKDQMASLVNSTKHLKKK